MNPVDILRLLSLAAIWGASFLFMRIVAPEIGTIPTAFFRVSIAAAGLLVILVLMRTSWDFRGKFKTVLLLGVINSGIPATLYSVAAQVLPAGYSAIFNATTPLMGVLIGGLFFHERLSLSKLAGLALGLFGVAILTRAGPVAFDAELLMGALACLLATTCYGFAGFLARRWLDQQGGLDSRLSAFGSMLGASLFLLPLFAYSLRPGGALLLGGSETVGHGPTLFAPVNPKSRLYWRNSHTLHAGAVDFPVGLRSAVRPHHKDFPVPASTPSPANLQTLAEQTLLKAFAPAAVLVNDQGDVLYVHGSVGPYLEPAAGKANWNIHVMARPTIRTQVAVALRQALHDGATVELVGLRLDEDGSRAAVDVTVSLVGVSGAPSVQTAPAGLLLVAFRPAPVPTRSRRRPAGGELPSEALQAELQRCKDEIQALRLEMGASAEELQAANEALQSVNEELQSANEELTTSKEEAQSMNEELQTINNELQTRLDDLALAQSDMQNLLNSTDIATLFLDNGLNVRRYTEQAVPIFHLRESDVGRPLSDLANTLDYPSLLHDVQATLQSLTAHTQAVSAADGRWFSVRIMPYKTLANTVNGAVLTFVDISASKALEFRLREAQLPAPSPTTTTSKTNP